MGGSGGKWVAMMVWCGYVLGLIVYPGCASVLLLCFCHLFSLKNCVSTHGKIFIPCMNVKACRGFVTGRWLAAILMEDGEIAAKGE